VRTLVLDLDDVLVHSDWSRARGWRTFKRPGAEDFLRTMSQFYEVVVYTSQLPTYADPILDRLDPQRYIAYRLVPLAAHACKLHHYTSS
jgi:mitochondrial import inner membrane translocase subunit TIM50